MNIDETTGLPELPEGMFWRVTHPRTYTEYGLYPTEALEKLQVGLIKEVEHRWHRSAPDRRKWWEKLIGRPKPSEEEVVEVSPTQVGSEQCETPDREGIMDAAATVLHRYEKRERIATLVGNYPPKSLSNKEEA